MANIRRRCALVSVAVGMTLIAVPASAGAASAGPLRPAPAIGSARTLTLVTGDRVLVSGPMGRQQVSVRPAVRADGQRPTFEITQQGGDVSVVPRDVSGLLPDRVDPRLFDVTGLLAAGYDRTPTPLVIDHRTGSAVRATVGPRATTGFAEDLDALANPGARTDVARIRLDTPVPAVPRTADGATVEIHLDTTARDGRPGNGIVQILDVEDGSVLARRDVPGSPTAPCTDATYAQSSCIRVPAGTYSIMGLVYTMPSSASSTIKTRTVLNTSLVGDPELVVDHDTTVALDARAAKEVRVETPDHPDATANLGGAAQLGFTRTPRTGSPVTYRVGNSPGAQIDERFYEQPTAPVHTGAFAAFTRMRLEEPVLTLSVAGKPGITLTPRYYDPVWFSDVAAQYPRLDGRLTVRVVDVGTATADEIAGRDLHGALAVARRSDGIPVGEQSNNAADAGAALVAVYNDKPGDDPAPGAIGIRLQVPTVSLSHEQGVSLLTTIGSRKLTAVGRPVSPYLYDLLVRRRGGIPDDPTFRAEGSALSTVVFDVAADPGRTLTYSEAGYPFQPGETASYTTVYPMLGGPRRRTGYYVADPAVRWSFGVHAPADPYNHLWPEPKSSMELASSTITPLPAGERRIDRWFGAPITSGLAPRDPLQRAGNVMHLHLNAFVDSSGHWADAYTTDDGITSNFTMYAGDTVVATTTGTPAGTANVPAGPATYRIVYDVDNAAPWAELSTHTTSTWTFRSAGTPSGQVRTEPLIVARYSLNAGPRNVIRAGSGPVPLGIELTHQTGATQAPFTEVTVDASYDGGHTWRATRVRRDTAGRYTALVPPLTPQHSLGYVALRTHIADTDGGTLDQTITRAFAISRFLDPR